MRPDVATAPPDGVIAAPPRFTPRAGSDAGGDLAARGRRIVADNVPIVAAQASIDAAAPLQLATMFGPPLSPRTMADSANARWHSESIPAPAAVDAARARDLYESARTAFALGRRDEAMDLQYRALASNPRDPELAGFLAYLHLHASPVRAETARTLALQALAFSGARRGTRFEDWNTFAVASALTGRQGDASRAYLLMLGLTGDAQRSCRAALRAQANFGGALRQSVDALAFRLRRDGRANEAAECLAAAPAG
jgi:tetratricopeptide (TPR) repeat protein